MKSVVVFFILVFPFAVHAQYDAIAVYPELNGQELIDMVVDDFKPSFVLPYGPARDSMFSNIYNTNDSLSCVYTGHKLYMDPQQDPTETVFLNGIDNGINTEHTYPRSKGAENGNAKSDMNHLFPTRVRVNSDRGSLPFDDIDDQNTTKWFINSTSQSQIPSQNIDGYSELDGINFEPREEHKGNVARAMFYFYTMYRAEADNADPDFFIPQIETLCRWHNEDPVDSLEWTRAFLIANYQDDKVNPFVLDCSLLGRTYCEEVPMACRSVSSINLELDQDINIFPVPFDDFVTIQYNFEGENEISIRVSDLMGRTIYTKSPITYQNNFETVLSSTEMGIGNKNVIVLQLEIKTNRNSVRQINRLLIRTGK